MDGVVNITNRCEVDDFVVDTVCTLQCSSPLCHFVALCSEIENLPTVSSEFDH